MGAGEDFHPDLRRKARFLPRTMIRGRALGLQRFAAGLAHPRPGPGVAVTQEITAGAAPVRLRVYRPLRNGDDPPAGPALLWLHGGGFVVGSARQDERLCATFARELGITVASVDYRLAPENPYPAGLDDCYAGLRWLHRQPAVDPARVAVGGASAGGALAAAVAQTAYDRGEVPVAFQLLAYPMLDDRTALRTDVAPGDHIVWNSTGNRFGWTSYLGAAAGSPAVTAPAAPGRREDLSGLPPAWIGVGSADLLHDESLSYAERLRAAGVPCEVAVIPGAFHGFDALVPKAAVTRDFVRRQAMALRTALAPVP